MPLQRDFQSLIIFLCHINTNFQLNLEKHEEISSLSNPTFGFTAFRSFVEHVMPALLYFKAEFVFRYA